MYCKACQQRSFDTYITKDDRSDTDAVDDDMITLNDVVGEGATQMLCCPNRLRQAFESSELSPSANEQRIPRDAAKSPHRWPVNSSACLT